MSDFVPSTGRPKQTSRGARIAMRIGIAIVVVACMAALAVVAVNTAFKAIDSSLSQKQVTSLSERTAQSNLTAALSEPPDLSGFSYIDTSNLIGPRVENIVVGEIMNPGPDSDSDAPTRDVSASAAYRNASIEVSVPVVQHYSFDENSSSWIVEGTDLGSPLVSPLRGLSNSAIEAALPELLRAYDSSVADQFEECSISVLSYADETGGTATATLSKTEKNKSYTCDVDLSISWLAALGWQVSITSVGEVKQDDATSTANATMSMTCATGDTVELSGTIESADGVIVLKTSQTISVMLDGKGYTTNQFCLTSADGEREVSLGASVTLQGTISASGTTSEAPLSISVTKIS